MAVSARAPDFEAQDENGATWRLSEALQRAAQVLVFYRGDEITAICVDTLEPNRAMIDKLLLPFKILDRLPIRGSGLRRPDRVTTTHSECSTREWTRARGDKPVALEALVPYYQRRLLRDRRPQRAAR